MTSTSMSWNYFMYGYTNETTVGGESYDALSTDFNYKIYSVQTFASLTYLNTYISEKGLTTDKLTLNMLRINPNVVVHKTVFGLIFIL